MESKPGGVTYFELHGLVGDVKVSATWHNGRLMADEEVLDRADLLIAAEQMVSGSEEHGEVRAGLSEPFAAALTLIGSFDRISSARVLLGTDEENETVRVAIEVHNTVPRDG